MLFAHQIVMSLCPSYGKYLWQLASLWFVSTSNNYIFLYYIFIDYCISAVCHMLLWGRGQYFQKSLHWGLLDDWIYFCLGAYNYCALGYSWLCGSTNYKLYDNNNRSDRPPVFTVSRWKQSQHNSSIFWNCSWCGMIFFALIINIPFHHRLIKPEMISILKFGAHSSCMPYA